MLGSVSALLRRKLEEAAALDQNATASSVYCGTERATGDTGKHGLGQLAAGAAFTLSTLTRGSGDRPKQSEEDVEARRRIPGKSLSMPIGWEIARTLWRGRVCIHHRAKKFQVAHAGMARAAHAAAYRISKETKSAEKFAAEANAAIPELKLVLEDTLRNLDLVQRYARDVEALLDRATVDVEKAKVAATNAAREAAKSNRWASKLGSIEGQSSEALLSSKVDSGHDPKFNTDDFAKLDAFLEDDSDDNHE